MPIWSQLHKHYQQQEWSKHPSLFAEWAISFFPTTGTLLDLGTGLGQDAQFFHEQGYTVTALDLEPIAVHRPDIAFVQGDLTKPFIWKEETFDIVYAHLSLHYFSTEETRRLLQEISRVLVPGGIFATLLNSIHDPEYNTGERIEGDYFQIDGVKKRYFSSSTIQDFTHSLFSPLHIDEEGESYKDRAKGVDKLVRFVGKKLIS